MPSLADTLAERVQAFAIHVVSFVKGVPCDPRCDAVLRQLVRSATSVSANYRAARRARSRAEFVAKIGLVAEEADETEHWLELLIGAQLVSSSVSSGQAGELLAESRELRAIFVQSARTARANHARSKSSNP